MVTTQLDRIAGTGLNCSDILLKTAIRQLENDHPYFAWRLLDRMVRGLGFLSIDCRLLQAKALEKCQRPGEALEILETAQRLFPQSHSLSNYLLRLLAVADPIPEKLATDHARFVIRQQNSIHEILQAIQLLKQLKVTPIGMCHFDGEKINGWLLDAPSLPALTVTIDGNDYSLKPFLSTPLFQQKAMGSDKDGFSLQVPPNRYQCIRIHLNGVDLAGSPIFFKTPVLSSNHSHPFLSEKILIQNTVDIIVPVYKGYAETKVCLESVLASKNRTAYRLIVVDDASQEVALVNYLNDLAENGSITLFRQPFNSGFVKAVNRGIQASNNRDVILLNADTRVHGDWLDRLRNAAYRDDDIGTVTPMTNNGELVSYPTPMKSSAMPSANLLEELNKLCNLLGDKAIIDIPVGVGFCLYIKRRCLIAAGGFDNGLIERGYCEDTDFCIRASQNGWRNVCAANVFVAHAGNVSFGTEKSTLVSKNLARIYALYPEHSEEYEQFLLDDPLQVSRNFLQRRLLPFFVADQAELIVLSEIVEGDYRYEHLANLLSISSRKLFYLLLKFDIEGGIVINLQSQITDSPIDLNYCWPKNKQQFWQDLFSAGFKYIDIHDLSAWPLEIMQGLANLNRPYRLFLADYSGYCPQKTLTQPLHGYCGDPVAIGSCIDCVKNFGSRVKGMNDVQTYRKGIAQIFANATSINLPAMDGVNRYRTRFPGVRFNCEAIHENPSNCQPNLAREMGLIDDAVLRIAVLQTKTPDDGFFKLLEMARLMASKQLNAELIVFGSSWDDSALMATGKVWVTGKVSYHDLPTQIRKHNCSLVFHPAIWPQLDATPGLIARQCELPLAVPAMGVFNEMINKTPGDILLDPSQTVSDWLAEIVKIKHSPNA